MKRKRWHSHKRATKVDRGSLAFRMISWRPWRRATGKAQTRSLVSRKTHDQAAEPLWTRLFGMSRTRILQNVAILLSSMVLVASVLLAGPGLPRQLWLIWMELPILFLFQCLRWWVNRVLPIEVSVIRTRRPLVFWQGYAEGSLSVLASGFFVWLGLRWSGAEEEFVGIMETGSIITALALLASHALPFLEHMFTGRYRETPKGPGPESWPLFIDACSLSAAAIGFGYIAKTLTGEYFGEHGPLKSLAGHVSPPDYVTWVVVTFILFRAWLMIIFGAGERKLELLRRQRRIPDWVIDQKVHYEAYADDPKSALMSIASIEKSPNPLWIEHLHATVFTVAGGITALGALALLILTPDHKMRHAAALMSGLWLVSIGWAYTQIPRFSKKY